MSDPGGPSTEATEVTAPPAAPETESPKRGVLRFFKELPVLVIMALVIALVIKAFLVQAFYIPSASMEPTLTQGDRVLVSKLSYRLGEPKRGDVVVFRSVEPDPCAERADRPGCQKGVFHSVANWIANVFGLPTGDTKDLIKRIVALPGETIQLSHGTVYVCDTPKCHPLDKDGKVEDGHVIDFPHSATKGPQKDDYSGSLFRVPKDAYFVMGDNRGNSSDSRFFHEVPKSHVIGKAFVLIWPFSRFGGL